MENLSPAQLTQLALDYKALGDQLMKYINDMAGQLTTLQYSDLSNRVGIIYHNVTLLSALSTYQTVQNLTPQLNSIKQAATQVSGVLKTIADVQKAINIAADVVDIGTSILSFNIGNIVSGVGSLVTDINS